MHSWLVGQMGEHSFSGWWASIHFELPVRAALELAHRKLWLHVLQAIPAGHVWWKSTAVTMSATSVGRHSPPDMQDI